MKTPEPELTSTANPEVKRVARLKDRKGRRESGLFVVEGLRLLAEAMASDWPLQSLYLTPACYASAAGQALLAARPAARVRLVSEQVLAAMADTQHPQGALGVLRWQPKAYEPTREPLCLALDGVQDPGNVGSLVRSAAAFGVHLVVVGAGTADPSQPKVVRGAMGALFRVPVETAEDLPARLTSLRAEGVQVVALAPQGEALLGEADLTRGTVLVIGNEGAGVSQETLALADLRCRIPMQGGVESLNAAMAGTVALYEAYRQRGRFTSN